jgi:hypothetical protein
MKMQTLYLAMLVRGMRLLLNRVEVTDANPLIDYICCLTAEREMAPGEADLDIIPQLCLMLTPDLVVLAEELEREFYQARTLNSALDLP